MFSKKLIIPEYEQAPHQFLYEIDNSLPFSAEGVCNNPDRGFRGETYITLGSLKAFPEDKNSNTYTDLDEELSRYPNQDVKILQVYVYLIEFYNKPISEEALLQLTQYFEKLREKNIRVLLRFAYEYISTSRKGPTTKTIISHCSQLKKWFDDNKPLVNDTIYAVQFGVIGLWGEGHGSVHRHNVTKLIDAVCNMVPEQYTVMVRYPRLLSKAPEKHRKRLSVHDDFLVGIDHPWGLTIKFTSPYYEPVLRLNSNKLCDGEMPWGRDNTVKNIDPFLVTKQVVNYSLTTLSLRHNYNEDGNDYCLEQWKNVFLTEKYLKDNNYPFAPFLLKDDKISVFDYFKYHLGYLLAISNIVKSDNGYDFIITNFGLNAPYDYDFYVATKDGDKLLNVNVSKLTKFGQQKVSVISDDEKLSIKIKNKNSNNFIKLANQVKFKNGYNIISL